MITGKKTAMATALIARSGRTGTACSCFAAACLRGAGGIPAAVAVLPVPPEELPQKTPNTTYFFVDTRHPFGRCVRNARNKAVFGDLPPEQTLIRLYPVDAEE